MKIRLIVEQAPHRQAEMERSYTGGQLIIGRADECDWQFTDPDMFVSRRHAILTEEGGRVMVTDASSGGLYIDNAANPLGTGNSVPLEPGMRLRMGEFVIRTEDAGAAAGTAPAAPSGGGMGFSFDFGAPEPPKEPTARPDSLPDPFGVRPQGRTAPREAGGGGPPRPLDQDDPFSLDLSGSKGGSSFFEGGQERTPPRATDSRDPFAAGAGGAAPAAGGDPFGASSGARKSDPFGADPFGTGPSDAGRTPPPAGPKGGLGADPFGGGGVRAQEPAPSAPPPGNAGSDPFAADFFGLDNGGDAPAPRPEPPAPAPPQADLPPAPEPEDAAPARARVRDPFAADNAPQTAAPGIGAAGTDPSGASTASPAPTPPADPTPTAPVPPQEPTAAPVPAPPTPAPAPAQAPTAPVATTADAEALRAALFKGLGLDPKDFPTENAAAEMESIGEQMRILVEGVMLLLRARAQEKGRARVAQTLISSSNVNPLKFLVTTDDALSALIKPRGQGYLAPKDAVAWAFRDLTDHQLRTWTALQSSLRRMIDTFDPSEIERQMEDTGYLERLIAGGRSAKLWQLYTERYGEIAKAAEEQFLGEVGQEFREAYETKGSS